VLEPETEPVILTVLLPVLLCVIPSVRDTVEDPVLVADALALVVAELVAVADMVVVPELVTVEEADWLRDVVTVVDGDVISHPQNVPALCRLISRLNAAAKASQVSLLSSVMTKKDLKQPISLKSVPGN
jgi:hypothetical protein